MTLPESLCPCCAAPAEPLADHPHDAGCPRCGHRWRNAPEASASAGYYAELVARNDEQAPWFSRKIDARLAAILALIEPATARVLEVGCAEGGLGAAVKARSAVTYDGIELSQDSVLAATRLDQVFRQPAAQVHAAPYDLIVSFHVLEHIADLTTELLAWRRLLAEQGALLIEVPNRAGHPWLSNDLNQEHLHQFTPASLAILLASCGFTCRELSSGHYESPLYCDSIQVIARPEPTPAQRRQRLLQRFEQRLGGPFIAYGIGGDYLNYVAPLADALPIRALVDSAAEKSGQQVGAFSITAYDPVAHDALPILICSLRYGNSIRRQLLAQGIAAERLVALESLFDAT
ncbi:MULTISPECIES: class I SAM-dependent methyltransferase [Pseudomonas]|uniref:class I SAM-dependent methyltransferase n=1 Tax=Pseudomonas nitroreducens TaxID=46680 RepID=UPI001FECEA0A|nr:class I SAM-dependent methyltransferase [Pseudomonas nitritireducens]